MTVIPFKAKQIQTDAKGIREACIAFDITAGHDHDGANSKMVNAKIAIARAYARPQLPNIIVGTNDPRELDGNKVEYLTGNITKDLQEMEIVGGSATASGHSWMYWDFSPAKKVYVRASLKKITSDDVTIDILNGSGSTLFNPPHAYILRLYPAETTKDVLLGKLTPGWTHLGYEFVDLEANVFYDFEIYFEGDGVGSNRLMIWRNGKLIFNILDSDPNFLTVVSVRFRVRDLSTTEAQSGAFGKPFIVSMEE